MAKEGTKLRVNLGLPELVEVPQELEHMSTTASRKGKWGPVVSKVLAKGVPVTALLVLIAAECCGGGVGGGGRR